VDIEIRRLEEIVDSSALAPHLEALLPVGVRPRQLRVHTLLLGMLLALRDGRPAHLTRVHEALCSLPVKDKQRLGVIARWKDGEHELTYRQTERTYGLLARALAKQEPDGLPSEELSGALDALMEASVHVLGRPETSALAIDWTDYESFARPPHGPDQRCADPEAAWGHRTSNHPGISETFFGYYLQAATIVKEEGGEEVPEFVRRISLSSPKHDPPAHFVPVLERMATDGVTPGDLLADSGYSYREPHTFAAPLRALGSKLVLDLHPNDRGQKGTHMGAVTCNGSLYCPATPQALFELSPLAPGASAQQAAAHARKCEELHRYKLSPITAYDQDGYRRVACPATRGKLRCPLRAASMELSHERPTILKAPEHPPVCCTQQTITVPASVAAKTQQKHDYPSAEHRRSYARRSAAERAFARVFDPAAINTTRGWCRLTGLTPNALFLACAFVATNIRVADAFTTRKAENEHRRERGLPPRRRRRRRRTLHDLAAAKANAPPR
jgi:hypothetical protein